MYNAKDFINNIELYIEINELKQLDFSEEEIIGFLEVFYDNWNFSKNLIFN